MPISMVGYSLVFGKTLVFWTGISVITMLFITAIIGFLNFKGNHAIQFKWHPRFAGLTLLLALIHATLALLAYF